jgi:hypothetical protein
VVTSAVHTNVSAFSPPPARPRAWQCIYDEETRRWVVVRFDAFISAVITPTAESAGDDCRQRAERLCAALNRIYGLDVR